jgi:hypothetical protein
MTNRLDPIDAPVAQTDMLVTEVLTLLAEKLPVKRSRIHAALLDAGWDGLARFVSVDVVCQAINLAHPGYAALIAERAILARTASNQHHDDQP